MASPMRRGIVALGVVIVIAAAVGAAAYVWRQPVQPASIVGVVRTTEITVAPEVGGQLASIKVGKGARVRMGDVVAELNALELTASVAQARAVLASAEASRNNVYAGVRAEEVAGLAAEIDKAKSKLTYAELQLNRISTLAHDAFSSQQSLDQAVSDAATARADVAQAQANYASAKAGPTQEERAIADAQVKAAAAALQVLESRLNKTILRAPADGVVSVVVGEIGEAVSVGQPVLTIEETSKRWLSFNVREDGLRGLTVGTKVDVARPGASEAVPAVVTEIQPLGSFATWQAERAVGDHDLNTLGLRLDPQTDPAGLEPGMTIWLVQSPPTTR
jgi:HlyD family secretion protein